MAPHHSGTILLRVNLKNQRSPLSLRSRRGCRSERKGGGWDPRANRFIQTAAEYTPPMRVRALAVVLILILSAPSVLAATLHYSFGADRHVVLRRAGERLLIASAHSGATLAAAPAATTDRVVIRGASGAHDDTLTVELSSPIVLRDGIDYDGGAGGWDTLVLQGGSAREQRVTQLSPHDGEIDVDGLLLRYTNLEPITDTAPAASYTINGTAGPDFVTFSDGPGGTTTVSSPSFESVTFANKTNVVFDGAGGDDSVSFNNPNPATGLTSLIVTNVGTVFQSAAIKYLSLGVNATGLVSLQDLTNDVDRVEITTQNGTINYHDADDLIVGGVSPSLAGVRAVQSGHVGVQTVAGNLVLDDTDGAEIIRAGADLGGITLNAGGGTSDLIVIPDRDAAIAPAGMVYLQVFGDLVLGSGGATFSNDIRAATSITLTVLGSIQLGGQSTIMSDAFGMNSGGELLIFYGPAFTQTGDGRAVAGGTAGADASILSGTGTLQLLGTAPGIESSSGDVWLIARGVTLAPTSSVTAPLGEVELTAHGLVLGAATDIPDSPVELSDAELDRIIAPVVALHTSAVTSTPLQVTQPITFTSGTELILRTSNFIDGIGGTVSALTLTFEIPSFTPMTWTITPTSVQTAAGSPLPYSGVTTLNARGRVVSSRWAFPSTEPDTFAVAPSPTTTINIDGHLPTPPATPGDVLDFDLAGVASPVLSATLTATGHQGSLTSSNRQPVNFQNIEQLIDAPVDLGITKSDGATTSSAGTTVTYAITVSNPSSIAVGGATVNDTFPPALTGVTWNCTASAGSSCTTSGSGNLTDTVTLAANGSVAYTVTATLPSPIPAGTLTNTATVTTPAGFVETNAANNTATDVTTITTEADIVVEKTTSAVAPDRGDVFSYTITLRNAGPSDAQSISLVDALPSNTLFVSLAAPPGYTCTTPAVGTIGTVTCTVATLPPSTTVDTFTLMVRVDPATPPGSTITNSVTATSTTTDPSSSNTASATVQMRADIPSLSMTMLLLLAALLGVAGLRMVR